MPIEIVEYQAVRFGNRTVDDGAELNMISAKTVDENDGVFAFANFAQIQRLRANIGESNTDTIHFIGQSAGQADVDVEGLEYVVSG